MEIDEILSQRGQQYGKFSSHACISQALKRTMQVCNNWEKLNNAQREALEMIMHKVARILNGNPNHKDSWTDIIGYARLVEEKLEEIK